MDAAVGDDAGPDGGLVDAPEGLDGAATDSGLLEDAGLDGFVPGTDAELPDAAVPDPCLFVAAGTPCAADGTCAAGATCLDNGCGVTRCYASGSPCGDVADCPMGSTCEGGTCVRASGGCGDSRDCPAGFSCDAGACVDRRIGCNETTACPEGFLCDMSLAEGAPYCFRANTPCVADSGCLFFGACRDVVGTGSMVCAPRTSRDCTTNAECTAAGEVCGVHPVFFEALCRPHGPCASAADCASGASCADLWGDGVPECVPSGGTCVSQSECPVGAVCAIPFGGGAPRCISRPV